MSTNKIWKGGASRADGPDLSSLMTREDNSIDQNLVDYEILGLLAYHIELAKAGVLPPKESGNIVSALLNLQDKSLAMTGDYEDVHSLVEDKVNSFTGSGSNLRVFLSRNDQSHYDIRSFYLDSLLELSQKMVEICGKLHGTLGKSPGYMPGYTHYRQAMPLSISTYFDYLGAMFLEFSKEAILLYNKLSKYCPLGYGSGYGSAVKVDESSLARMLGFEEPYLNPVMGASYRGLDEVDIASYESKLMLFISRVAQDFILFSSDEFGFLKLPDGFTTGSSLMPNKRNPDFLEMLEGYASESLGVLTSAISILMNKGLGYHREFQLSKDKVIRFTGKVSEILDALHQMISSTGIDQDKSKKLVQNATNATMEAYGLFTSGTPWKEAYRIVGSKLVNGEKLGSFEPEPSTTLTDIAIEDVRKNVANLKKSRRELKLKIIKEASKISSS